MNKINYIYYPCAGFDGSAVKIFAHHTNVFIYVDTEYNVENIRYNINHNPFRGYVIDPSPIKKPSLKLFLEEMKEINGYCTYCCFKRKSNFSKMHGPRFFTVFFIKGDGIGIYNQLNGNPNVGVPDPLCQDSCRL